MKLKVDYILHLSNNPLRFFELLEGGGHIVPVWVVQRSVCLQPAQQPDVGCHTRYRLQQQLMEAEKHTGIALPTLNDKIN